MKDINDYTEEELLALDQSTIDTIINYKCAEAGIDLLPDQPSECPVKTSTPPDLIGYRIAGIITTEAEHAQRILEAIYSSTIYDSDYQNSDYDNKFLKELTCESYSAPKIETSKYHSAEQWKLIKDDLREHSARKAKWEKLSKEYKQATEARQDIVDEVNNLISTAQDRSYTRDSIRRKFNQYLELAENNKSIALNFLLKVQSLNDFPELLSEFRPPERAEAPKS